MTTPNLAQNIKGKGRHYTHPHTHNPVPSVTNILNIINKPALPRWAAKIVAEQAAALRHSLPQLDPEEIVDMLKGAPWRSSTRSADRGTSIHEWLEAAITRTHQPDLYGEAVAYQPAAQTWMDDVGQHLDVIHTEQTMFHERYAGTADLIVQHDGHRTVIDFKTSKAIYDETALQLAALAACTINPDGDEEPPCTQAIVVRLGPNGKYQQKTVDDLPRHQHAFINALELWHWQHEKAYA